MSEYESKQLDVEYITGATVTPNKVKSDVIAEVKEMSFTFCFPLFFQIKETTTLSLFEKFS